MFYMEQETDGQDSVRHTACSISQAVVNGCPFISCAGVIPVYLWETLVKQLWEEEQRSLIVGRRQKGSECRMWRECYFHC